MTPSRNASAHGFNGATTMESWKTAARASVAVIDAMLQWGHDDGVVEDTSGDRRLNGVSSFNGATTMESWKTVLGFDAPEAALCFNGATTMEPWKTARRRAVDCRSTCFNGATTMEPWKTSDRQMRGSSHVSFNGATTMEPWKTPDRSTSASLTPSVLQWGHDDGVVEDTMRGAWTDPARIMLQWGHDNGVVEDHGSAMAAPAWRAASMGPRQWSRGRRRWHGWHSPCSRASMGPRRWSRGRPGPSLTGRRPCRSFNGATTMESWKTYPSGLDARRQAMLQWGHDNGVVEDAESRPTATRGADRTSMGPRQWSRGRLLDSAPRAPRGVWLQWGHDNGVVEDIERTDPRRRRRSASMGPRQWSRGRLSAIGQLPEPVRASMGPRQWSRGRRRRRGSLESSPTASMGPRQWSRGRPWSAVDPRRYARASMGPRQWSRGRRSRDVSIAATCSRFNGATTMESWKTQAAISRRPHDSTASMGPRQWSRGRRRRQHDITRCRNAASMGPRQWSRGRQEPRRPGGARLASFNGATTMESWKTLVASNDARRCASMGPRQWSRGRPDARSEVHPRSASMGPRQWSRGRPMPRRSSVGAVRRFNGATTMESWKTRSDSAPSSNHVMLQWGHDNGVVEDRTADPPR